ncbi:MAG: hypothetical protein OXI87_18720 [Albidovulum sp.]|nr:hypothetical protein [Albidovulum sp.]
MSNLIVRIFVISLALTLPVAVQAYKVDLKNCRSDYAQLNHDIYYAWATLTENGRKHAEKVLHDRKGKNSNKDLIDFQNNLAKWKNKTPEEALNEIKKTNDITTACLSQP